MQVLAMQSAKILLVPPKYERVIVLSDYLFFQYCDSNIGLFSIDSCKVSALFFLSLLYFISLLLFLELLLFFDLRAIAKKYCTKIIFHFGCTNIIFIDCTLYSRYDDQYWQIAYPKYLVAQNCIKKDLFFFIYLRMLSRLRGQFCSTVLVQSNIWHKKCLITNAVLQNWLLTRDSFLK